MSDHLVVLCHGLWGNPSHMWFVKESILSHTKGDKIHILTSKSNSGNRTYDGVDVCGERLANEVQEEVERLNKDYAIEKVSFVGYSLGGLNARYAIGVLEQRGFFEKIKANLFTTFATPHLGVTPPSTGFLNFLVSSIGPRTLSQTGYHLFLADRILHNRPLLELMSNQESSFYKGLGRFEKRVLYANIANDRSVPFFTAAISSEDPFQDLSKIRVNYDPDYGQIILDTQKPYSALDANNKATIVKNSNTSFREAFTRGAMLLLLPAFIVVYSIAAVFHTIRSKRRISQHKASRHEDDSSVLAEITQSIVEDVLEAPEVEGDYALRLNESQQRIVKNMQSLVWERYYVHIRNTTHSHAAIVRRHDKENMKDGIYVMKHWLNEVLLS